MRFDRLARVFRSGIRDSHFPGVNPFIEAQEWDDLQSVLSIVCQRANYDLTLNYRAPLGLPLSDADAAWVRECVETTKTDG